MVAAAAGQAWTLNIFYVASRVGPAVHHVTSTGAGLMAYSAFKQRAPSIHCKFKTSEFQALQQRLGITFTLDAFAKDSGSNRLCHQYCSPSSPFHKCDAAGELLWLHPPYLRVTQAIRHFRRCKQKNSGTAAVILLPKVHKAPWEQELKGMELIREY
eukprot:1160916-Pelagomonas_calceolata.AAC.4